MTRAAVFIIGAGPGDPGLITVRGLQCLQDADVVLYDHLVHARLLRHARPDAEKIDVGVAAPQPLEQEAICYLLAEKAREGKTVARLKWGDPFVFDRGGAETLFLHEQGVRFEVVPGIPAGIAIPTYAGVPITYPGGGDTLTFIRGHEDAGKARMSVDWASLARLDGTLVCYAGPEQLSHVLSSLLSHGRPPEDSAAVIHDGTLPTQTTKIGSIQELAKDARGASERRPALLIVGRVTALREHLRWFDVRPLFGKRVLVTRPREQASDLMERLEAAGADAIDAPMIRIVPPDDFGPLDEACRRVTRFDWIVFASVNAVDAFLDRLLRSPLDLRALGRTKLCAVGPATAGRLARHGLKVDFTPAEYQAAGILRAMSNAGDLHGAKILLPRADIGRDLLADGLEALGAEVTIVVAYRTVLADGLADGPAGGIGGGIAGRLANAIAEAPVDTTRDGDPDVYRMLLERRIDVVTFTSASAVHNFVKVVGVEPAADLLRATVVASIGPITAQAAAQYNIRTTIEPPQYTVPALVDAIVEYFGGQP